MASTNSSVGITINIVCKEVQYDFSDFPDYDFIRQAAISAVQKEYAEHQREEDEEIEDMLNDGSLSSADDFDRAYGEPFDPNKCEQRIVEVTEMYCRNVADLPKRVPLTADDCAVLGMDDAFATKYENPDYQEMKLYYSDAPRYYTKASIVEMWECSKDTIEDMLLVMSQTRSDHYKSIISADTNSFHEIYALHNAREWGEASKIDDAIQQYGIDMFSNITLTERQRHLVDDLKELQNIADRIAMCEEMCEKIADVRSKLMQHQNEREAALSKLSVQQRESAERN